MSEHLTSLALDEAASGEPFEAADRTHLASCAQCQAAVAERKALSERILASPQAQAMRARLLGQGQQRPLAVARAVLVRRVVLTALPLAAAIGLFFTAGLRGGDDDGDRVKGTVSVEVVVDGHPAPRAPLGAKVSVAVGAAGHGFAALFAFDPKSGQLDALHPTDGTLAPAPKGARASFGPTLEVTLGATRVIAVFADTQVPADAVRAAALAHARGQPLPAGLWATSVSLEVDG